VYIAAAAKRSRRRRAEKGEAAGGPERSEGRPKEDCIFCDLPAQRRDRANLILRRGRRTFVMLNRYPYTNGHLLVAPNGHVAGLDDLAPAALRELAEEVRDAVSRLRDVMKPDGFNVGLNLGGAAGAGYADHVHFHVVPRWVGDTNFMPVAGEVISQRLEETRKALEPAFRAVARRASSRGTGKRRSG
jgi:ATP adenylyltransferase